MAKELNDQIGLINTDSKENAPVVCLGMSFENDEARRAYFTGELREKLPKLKKIEGFPIGEDEDILALSDPPYYTACPNPFIPEFIEQWGKAKKEMYVGAEKEYNREPFAADVSEGKNNPIYRAHTYHTKVPHKAIMHFILHYTEPGDIIYDGFCGTGMTGVAAQMCGNKLEIESLGYEVKHDGTIVKKEVDEDGNSIDQCFSMLGQRFTILNDLAPVGTFIARNYTSPISYLAFEKKLKKIISEIEKECGWMYETRHTNGGIGHINSTVWSDVFSCPECGGEIIYWKTAVSKDIGGALDSFNCPSCNAILSKRDLEKEWVTVFDECMGEPIRQAKQVPVLISYTYNKKRYQKSPDEKDIKLISSIENTRIPYEFPSKELPDGFNTSQPIKSHGIMRTHHFHTKRNLWVLSKLASLCRDDLDLLFVLTGVSNRSSKMNRIHLKNYFFGGGGWNPGEQKGTLYISSLPIETSLIELLKDRISAYRPVFATNKEYGSVVINTSSAERQLIDNDSIDYIFLDPPFGSNINYSELNFLWESWLRVWSNNKREAIENSIQGKSLEDYRELMKVCFIEAYRILKPGRWMTVEFSNTNASVWNSIQTALSDAGFVVANVAALDKKQGGFKAITGPTAVKQDLVISAYKPSSAMKEEIRNNLSDHKSAWLFVRNHLDKLPVFIGTKGSAEVIVERTPRVLFDRMVAYHVQNGYIVPISSGEFQAGIAQRFPMRDGMVFLESQVAEYDKKRILVKEFVQMNLFVSDESSAIEWIRQQLLKKPQTRQDIYTGYIKEIQHISKFEKLPELDILLEQNFLQYEGEGPVPSQIHGYLSTNFKDLRELDKEDPSLRSKAKERWYVPDPNKQADLEKLREKSLMREFAAYVDEIHRTKKKLKQFRLEAIRAGFKKAWGDKDYKTIVDVGSKIPENVLQEDDKLLMYYDNAQIRLEA